MAAVATYLPSSIYVGGASGNLTQTFYVPATNTSSGGGIEGVGVVASLAANANAVLQFNLGTTSTGTLSLRALAFANATSGAAKWATYDGVTAPGSNIGATSLTSSALQTTTWTSADVIMETNVGLASSPSSNGVLTVLVQFQTSGWTLAQSSVWQFSVTQ